MSFAFAGAFEEEAQRNINKYPADRKPSAVLSLLFIAQEQQAEQQPETGRYVTGEAISAIAARLEMPEIRVWEVATFFTQINLKPIGKFHLQLCGTTPCQLCGAEELKQAVLKSFGNDKDITLTEVECLGACCNAPMVQINDDYYEDLTPDGLVDILNRLKSGESVPTGSQSGRTSSEPIKNAIKDKQ